MWALTSRWLEKTNVEKILPLQCSRELRRPSGWPAELAAGHCSELASRGVGGANEGSFYRAFVVAPVSVALRCVRVIRQTSPDEPRTEERSTTPNPTSPASATSSGSPNASSFQLCTVSLRTSSASARREQAGFVSASLAGLATTRVAVRRLPSI